MKKTGYQPQANTPLADREAFTTNDVAKICRMSIHVVHREFDAGRLAGFRIPGSKFRRITRLGLLLWMDANGIPQTFLTDFKEDDK